MKNLVCKYFHVTLLNPRLVTCTKKRTFIYSVLFYFWYLCGEHVRNDFVKWKTMLKCDCTPERHSSQCLKDKTHMWSFRSGLCLMGWSCDWLNEVWLCHQCWRMCWVTYVLNVDEGFLSALMLLGTEYLDSTTTTYLCNKSCEIRNRWCCCCNVMSDEF